MIFRLLFVFLLTLGIPVAHADLEQPPPGVHSRVVRVSNPTTGTCGTGIVLASGDVVTNAHLIAGLCPQKQCSGLEITRADDIGQRPNARYETAPGQLRFISHALDLAIIVATAAVPTSGLEISPAPGTVNQTVWVVGFPECRELTASRGQILGRDEVHLALSAAGKFGSSGSAVLDAEGRLLAVVDEALRLSAGVRAKVIGGTFQLRAVAAEKLPPLLAAPDEDSRDTIERQLLRQIALLASRSTFVPRLRLGMDYIVAMTGRIKAAVVEDSPLSDARSHGPLYLERGPTSGLSTPAELEEEQLLVSLALEQRGAPAADGVANFLARLERFGRPDAHREQVSRAIETERDRGYPGFERGFMRLGFGAVLLGLGLVALLFWGLRRWRRSKR